MSPTSPDLVRQAITARVSALVVDTSQLTSTTAGYAHATSDTWREAEEPLVPELEPSTRAHLAFFVDDRDTNYLNGRANAHDGPLVIAPLVVRFLARIRPHTKKQDWDRAARAGRALFAWLLQDFASDTEVALQRPASGQLLRRVPIGGTDGNGDFVSVEVRVDAVFNMSLE